VKRYLLSLAALVGIWAYFAGAILVGSGSLYWIDTALIDLPFRIHAARAILNGHFPFWTSLVECGFPQFSDGQTGILYPFFALYLISPTPVMHDAFVAVHYLIAALAMYGFLVHCRIEPWAAVVGAASYMGGPLMYALHVVPGVVSTLCWLPLALMFLKQGECGHRRSYWWCAGVNALIALAGCPNLALASYLVEALYLIKTSWSRRWVQWLGQVAVIFAVPALVAAVQLWPTYQYFRQSHRAESVPWEAVAVNSAQSPREIVTMGASWAYPVPAAWQGFVLVGALGVIAASRYRSRSEFWFWFVLGLLGLLIAVGSPLTRLLYFFPVAGWFRWPVVYAVFTYLAISILMAQGATVVLQALRRVTFLPRNHWAHAVSAVGSIAAAILAISGARLAYSESDGDFYALASPDILKASRQSGHFRLLPLLHGAVEGREPDKPQQFWSQQRMRDSALTLAPDYNLIHSVPVAILKNQVDAVTPRELTELVTSSVPIPWGLIRVAAVTHISEVDPLPSQLEAETELISTDPVLLYRVKNPLPRAWMVYDLARIDDRRQRLARINDPSFDPRRLAVVETEINISPPPPTSDDAIDNYVNFSEPSPGSLHMEVETAREGLLVIADRYAPEIAATLDGQPVPLYRVNHAFRGVVVPPGKHLVEMRYVPTAFYQGLAISAIGLGVFVIGCTCAGRRERKPIAEPIDPSPPPSIAPQIVTNR
jgi:hypothetical protein